jgi:hypothetical protein
MDAVANGVAGILGSAAPVEVPKPAVGRIVVSVQRHRAVWARADERLKNEDVDSHGAAARQTDAGIRLPEWREDPLRNEPAPAGGVDDTEKRTNAPETAYLVAIFVTGDRKPEFG